MREKDFIDAIIDFLDMFFNRIDNEMYEKAVRVNKTGVKKKVKKIEEPKKNELFMYNALNQVTIKWLPGLMYNRRAPAQYCVPQNVPQLIGVKWVSLCTDKDFPKNVIRFTGKSLHKITILIKGYFLEIFIKML